MNSIRDSIGRTCTNIASRFTSGTNELKQKYIGRKVTDSLSEGINTKLKVDDTIGQLTPHDTNRGVSLAIENGIEEFPSSSTTHYDENIENNSNNVDDFCPIFKRQKSMKSMNIRADQESDALEEWNQIVTFCKQVIY